GLVHIVVVVYADAAAKDEVVAQGAPGYSETRRELLAVPVDERLRIAGLTGRDDTDVSGRHERAHLLDGRIRDHDLACLGIKHREEVVSLGPRPLDFPTQAVVGRQLRRDPDLVLKKRAVVALHSTLFYRGKSAGRGGRDAQQKIRVGEPGKTIGERVVAEHIGGRRVVFIVVAPEFESRFQRMAAMVPAQRLIAEMNRVVIA